MAVIMKVGSFTALFGVATLERQRPAAANIGRISALGYAPIAIAAKKIGILVEAPGIEPPDTSVRSVVNGRQDDADCTTRDDSRRREVSALSGPGDPVEQAISWAILPCRRGESV